MSSHGEDGAAVGSVYSARSSVSATDSPGVPHKHISPHIGQVDSGRLENGGEDERGKGRSRVEWPFYWQENLIS